VKQLQKSFRDPQFQKYFQEYLQEISDPKARAEQDQYLRELERKGQLEEVAPPNTRLIRGKPAFCVRAATSKKNHKLFVNFCTHDDVKPATPTKAANGGTYWSVPFLSSSIRQEAEGVLAVDVIFATSSLVWAAKNPSAKLMMIATALDSLNARLGGGDSKAAESGYAEFGGLRKGTVTTGASDDENVDTSLDQVVPQSNLGFKLLTKRVFYGPRSEPDALSHRMQPNDPAVIDRPTTDSTPTSPASSIFGPAPPPNKSARAPKATKPSTTAPTDTKDAPGTNKAPASPSPQKKPETPQKPKPTELKSESKTPAPSPKAKDTTSNEIEPKCIITHVEVTNDVLNPATAISSRDAFGAALADLLQRYPGVNPTTLPQPPKRPARLQISIELPRLKNASQVELDLGKDMIAMKAPIPDSTEHYVLKRPLPYPVDVSTSEAKWRKEKKTLVVSAATLPPEPAEVNAYITRIHQQLHEQQKRQQSANEASGLTPQQQREREMELKQQARKAAQWKSKSSSDSTESPESQTVSPTPSTPATTPSQNQPELKETAKPKEAAKPEPSATESSHVKPKDDAKHHDLKKDSTPANLPKETGATDPHPEQRQKQPPRNSNNNNNRNTNRKARGKKGSAEDDLDELEAEVLRIAAGEGPSKEKTKRRQQPPPPPKQKLPEQPPLELPPRVPSIRDKLKPALRLDEPLLYQDEIDEAMAQLPKPEEIHIEGAELMSKNRVAQLQQKRREELERMMVERLMEEARARRKLMRRSSTSSSESSGSDTPSADSPSSAEDSLSPEPNDAKRKSNVAEESSDEECGEDYSPSRIRFANVTQVQCVDGTLVEEPLSEKESLLRQSMSRPKMAFTSAFETMFGALSGKKDIDKSVAEAKPEDAANPSRGAHPPKRHITVKPTKTSPAYRYLDALDHITITVPLKNLIESKCKVEIQPNCVVLDLVSPPPRPEFKWTIQLLHEVNPTKSHVTFSNANVVVFLTKCVAEPWEALFSGGQKGSGEAGSHPGSGHPEEQTHDTDNSEGMGTSPQFNAKGRQFLDFDQGATEPHEPLLLPGQSKPRVADVESKPDVSTCESKRSLIEVVDDELPPSSAAVPSSTSSGSTQANNAVGEGQANQAMTDKAVECASKDPQTQLLLNVLKLPVPGIFARTPVANATAPMPLPSQAVTSNLVPSAALQFD